MAPAKSSVLRVELTVLGGFCLRVDGEVMPPLPYDKARALLALLMVEPRAHPREQLADMLWPCAPMEQARANLRRALFDVRRCLGHSAAWPQDPLRADRLALALEPAAAHWHVDALALLDHAGHDREGLERQVAQYQGPLLAGLLLPDAPAFDRWLMGWRERVTQHMLAVLARLAALHEQEGHDAQALACCRRSLDIDAWQEPVQRRCVALLAKTSPAAALAHYEDYRRRLADELGLAPEPETRALVDEVRLRADARVAGSVPERRRIVVLACDLEIDDPDPEYRAEGLGPAVQAVAEVIAAHEGQLAQTQAGEILAYFGCPVAHERSPRRALDAALSLRDRVLDWPELVGRVGVHAGWVLMGPGGVAPESASGLSKRARRLAWSAPAGGVMVSAEALMLCDRHFVFEPAGPQEWLLGGRAPQGLLRPTAARPLPLQGREREMSVLRQTWAEVSEGASAACLICGEPGLGKSRLARELVAQVLASGARVTELVCQPEASHSPYHPILTALGGWLASSVPGSRGGVDERAVRRLLARVGLDHPGAVTTLRRLLGATVPHGSPDPMERRRQEEALLLALFDRLGEDRPQMLVVEDLHWSDPSTLDWLARVLASAATPVLLLCTSRMPPPALPWTFSRTIELGPLAHADMCRLVEESGLGHAQQRDVVRRADGIPLYAEEMMRALRDAPGEPVPPTLWTLLASRLDALGPAKRLAQEAALIGRDFDLPLLAAISTTSAAALGEGLERLCASGLLLAGVRQQYRFRHALIRDAAHHSLPLAERRALHQRVAQVLLSTFAERGAEAPELVAHHLMAAADPLAARHWLIAGRRGLAQSAYTEAGHDFGQGLLALKGLADSDPLRRDLEVPLQLAMGASLLAQQGYGSSEARACFDRACLLAEPRGGEELFQALWGKWLGSRGGHDDVPPLELAGRLMALAQEVGDDAAMVQACYALGNNHFFAGHMALARRWLHEATQRATALPAGLLTARCGEDVGLSAQGILSWTLALMGDVGGAEQISGRCVAAARAGAHAQSLCNALACAATMRHHLRQHDEAASLSSELMEIAQTYGLAMWQAVAMAIQGWSRQGPGGPMALDAVLKAVRQAVAQVALAMPSIEGTMQAFVVDMQLVAGRGDEALASMAQVMPKMVERHETYLRPEMWRFEAEALLQAGKPTEHAAMLFRQALRCAEEDGSSLFALRAACGLARLQARQGGTLFAEAMACIERCMGAMSLPPQQVDGVQATALLQGRLLPQVAC